MTKYSVPSFGGHIDFSDDVTIYPVLVMARTDPGSRPHAKLVDGFNGLAYSKFHIARVRSKK